MSVTRGVNKAGKTTHLLRIEEKKTLYASDEQKTD